MHTKSKSALGGEPIDQRLVHKHRIDNVLISNLRRALPIRIKGEVFESNILPFCSEKEQTLLKESYSYNPAMEIKEDYYLKGVVFMFPLHDVKTRLLNKELPKEDIKFFLKHYKKNRQKSFYTLVREPDDNEIIRIARIMGSKKNLVPDRKKTEISEIFERLNISGFQHIFYANMIVDTSHDYFFEHPNEHVPGMMLIEAVRQLLVACTHKYGRVPLAGYNFVLSSMTGTFKSYLELNYPVLFKVTQVDLYTYDSGIWADSEFKVYVYQNEKERAIITFQENIITTRVFNRLRSSKENVGKKPWFILKTNIEYRAIIRGDGLKKLDVQIEYISFNECILIIETSLQSIIAENQKTIEFFMYFSRIGFVHGTAHVKSENKFGDFSQVHIRFNEMDKVDKNNLQEVIKKYGYLVED